MHLYHDVEPRFRVNPTFRRCFLVFSVCFLLFGWTRRKVSGANPSKKSASLLFEVFRNQQRLMHLYHNVESRRAVFRRCLLDHLNEKGRRGGIRQLRLKKNVSTTWRKGEGTKRGGGGVSVNLTLKNIFRLGTFPGTQKRRVQITRKLWRNQLNTASTQGRPWSVSPRPPKRRGERNNGGTGYPSTRGVREKWGWRLRR